MWGGAQWKLEIGGSAQRNSSGQPPIYGWNYYPAVFGYLGIFNFFNSVAIIQPELNCIRMHIGLQLFAYFGGAIFFILFIIITTFPVIKLLNLSLIEGCAIE